MISIIICARQPDVSQDLKENIRSTIDAEYELIVIDNSENKYSIFTAYNNGVQKSHGDIVCFMHDDILFHTMGWGNKVESFFADDEKLGLLGIQACCFLPSVPSYWCDSPYVVYKAGKYNSFEKHPILEAVAVDGLWFCIKKELFGQIRFDDNTFSGFHYYDMDICMQVIHVGYKVCVCDIEMDHFRAGPGVNQMFYQNGLVFYNKWKDKLPIHRGITEPPIVLDMMDNLMRHSYNSDQLIDKLVTEKKNILKSKAYRLGKLILNPFSNLMRILTK